MRLLLDTHIFLWCIKDDKKLSLKAKKIISQATEVYISSVSIWEIAIKMQLNKLHADIDELMEAIPESGFLDLPINIKHAAGILDLANIHRDPFDRMLLSQAVTEPLILVTADPILEQYSELVMMV